MKPFKYIFIFLWFAVFFLAKAQKPELKFKHITPTEGLSHSFVRSICQDQTGFIWIATANGLNKYDGYDITVYRNDPDDKSSLISNDIVEIFVDSNDNLWVGTNKGIVRYNKELDNFERHPETSQGYINSFVEDSNHDLWVTALEFLYKYDKEKKVFLQLPIKGISGLSAVFEDSNKNIWVASNEGLSTLNKETYILNFQPQIKFHNVIGISEDKKNNLWIISRENGVLKYNLTDSSTSRYTHATNSPRGLPSNKILTVFIDSIDRVWLGTENGGLSIFNPTENIFYNYTNNESDDESLTFNSVYALFQDKTNNMWIGCYGGVDILKKNKFTLIRKNILVKNSLSNSNVLSFCEDNAGNVWIGTDGGGLNKWNRKTNTFINYKNDPKNPRSIGGNAITDLLYDSKGNIWIATWGGGLSVLEQGKKDFTHFYPQPLKPNTILHENLFSLYEDKQGIIWFSTSVGLDSYNPATGLFTHFNIPNSGLIDIVSDMIEDDSGNFWIGGFDGLYILNPKDRKLTQLQNDPKDEGSITTDFIYNFHKDKKGNLWIATAAGLNKYDIATKSFSAFRKKDGLPSDDIYGVLEDEQGFLWLSGPNGLSKLDPMSKQVQNFEVSDGLQGNEFKIKASLRLKSGEMLFGGANGFNIFDPLKIKANPTIPPVVITNFRIFNEEVPIGKDSPLKKSVLVTKEIELSYKESVFSLEFVALNYISPEKNQYAYLLEGLENKWNYVGNKRSATYTNLDPGEYIFKIKASNNDGIWNEEGTSLKIIVTPPFYSTWWFRFAIILGIAGIIFNWYSSKINSIAKQKIELEKQVRMRTSEISTQKEELSAQARQLQSANQELMLQKEQIDSQKKHIEKLFTDLKDSIRAAQVIQDSILPSESVIKSYLPEVFIFNKPKDVVGGDFYWFENISDKLVFAAVDCTGHGVSGAFMSITGHHLLIQAIQQSSEVIASDILDNLNRAVIKELNPDNKTEQTLDGMDISLCVIDKKRKKLQFAGANNPLYIVRQGEITQIKANRFPIGSSITGEIYKFTNNDLDIEDGDTIYMFSDGYPDQLGGKNGYEKFMYSRFRQLLLSISKEEMNTQLLILQQNLEDWKKEVPQLDDILVIGFKI